jgi:uncharacterized protein (TIGR02466 family)|tara:strand:- start:209 stop:895 length:687 start_codon:yes stop_codon:yes gene_type:complete
MQLFNIFPTTVYVGEVTDHQTHKEEFYKVYHKFDYEDSDANSTVSENTGRPFIHLEDNLDPLFNEIILHTKRYVMDVLQYKDIFEYVITKTWLSRTRSQKEIPWHIHSTSHISFVYYLNMPPNAHKLKFLNPHNKNSFFLGMSLESRYEERTMVKEFNQLNSEEFYIHPPEGTVALFPSSIQHCTQCVDKSFNDERLAIVGDITLTLKEDQLQYSMGYIDQKYWKKYK